MCILKKNLAGQKNSCIFASSFRQSEKTEESAFSLDSANGELGHFTNMMQEREKMNAYL